MASRIELFSVTIPAGTLPSAPLVTPILFDIATVDRIEVLVPLGCNGLVGFQLRHSGEGVFPREDNRWIVANGETLQWPIEEVPTGQAWAVRGYNQGIHSHTLYFRLLVSEIVIAAPVATAPLVITQANQLAPAAVEPGFPEGVA